MNENQLTVIERKFPEYRFFETRYENSLGNDLIAWGYKPAENDIMLLGGRTQSKADVILKLTLRQLKAIQCDIADVIAELEGRNA